MYYKKNVLCTYAHTTGMLIVQVVGFLMPTLNTTRKGTRWEVFN